MKQRGGKLSPQHAPQQGSSAHETPSPMKVPSDASQVDSDSSRQGERRKQQAPSPNAVPGHASSTSRTAAGTVGQKERHSTRCVALIELPSFEVGGGVSILRSRKSVNAIPGLPAFQIDPGDAGSSSRRTPWTGIVVDTP
jgi:hypothetical protein